MTAASAALPAPLIDPTPASVQALLDSADEARAHLLLAHALRHAVAHADVEFVAWLSGLEGRWSGILNDEVTTLEDEDGWGVVGMAIQSSCGQSEKEEVVRLVVGRWGVAAGPRDGRDRNGWTPLHLAALLSSPQTVSVLLNRGASLSAVNHAGFTAFDLVTGMDGRENLALLLDPWAGGTPRTPSTPAWDDIAKIEPERRMQIQKRRIRVATRADRMRRKEEEAGIAAERERWVRERAKQVGVDAGVLFPANRPNIDEEEEEQDNEEDEGMEVDDVLGGLSGDVRAKVEMDSSLLVFSLHQLPVIFDVFITSYRPVCQPRARRALPANALFLYARFAHYRCDESWLEELMWGAVEAIEGVVYGNSEDLASLAFWEYNITLLLYLLRSDKELATACAEGDDLLVNFEELINAIHVFIIRIAERKIDEILEPAMLDFEALEDFDGVRFADEWNIFRSFGRKNKDKRETPLAAAVFSPPSTPTKKMGDRPESPLRAHMSRPTSIQDLRATVVAARAEAKEVIVNGIGKAQAVLGDKPSPRKVADILTSVLLVLQLYEVNPAFNVQVFSQTFFWISSELFNRIITRRKYLCRTKAVQIRMNITALEDWTRANGLPPHIASRHFVPIMQLLQWLQCASQIKEFDMLIGTVQNLRSLNPLQMRRAVRDYRYEVNEGRMADDCNQYLLQLVRDWEQRRVHVGVQLAKDAEAPAASRDDHAMPIDALFDGSVSLAEWLPETGPEALGELLDSRHMLPFLMPQDTEHLLARPPADAAFSNLMTEKPPLPDGSTPSRPLSVASYSSSRPMGWEAPTHKQVSKLPDGFFAWLKQRQQAVQLTRDARRYREETSRLRDDTTPGPPVPPKAAARNSPEKPTAFGTPGRVADSQAPGTPSTPLGPLAEDRETTPVATERMSATDRIGRAVAHAFLNGPPPPLPPAQQSVQMTQAERGLARRASQELRSPDKPVPARESIELKSQSSNGSLYNAYATTPGSPAYDLATRHRRDNSSISSISSVSSSPDKKRWWPQIPALPKSPRVVSTASDDIPLQSLKDDMMPLGRLKDVRGGRQDSADTIRPAQRDSTEMLA